MLNEYLDKIYERYKIMAAGINNINEELNILLKINEDIAIKRPNNYKEAQETLEQFYSQIDLATVVINKWQDDILLIEKNIKNKRIDEKEGKKLIVTIRNNVSKLNKPINVFIEETKEYVEQTKQGINDLKHFVECFVNEKYRDIEGLCKIVSLKEVEENEYCLTPGRYVGYTIEIDKDYDYLNRISEISNELTLLSDNANKLNDAINKNLLSIK
jgi:type I restriction enzyme M protein